MIPHSIFWFVSFVWFIHKFLQPFYVAYSFYCFHINQHSFNEIAHISMQTKMPLRFFKMLIDLQTINHYDWIHHEFDIEFTAVGNIVRVRQGSSHESGYRRVSVATIVNWNFLQCIMKMRYYFSSNFKLLTSKVQIFL